MIDKQLIDLKDRMETILKLKKAPSQQQILFHLLGTARTISIKELSVELGLTPKAAERAVAKLLEKNLIQKSPFRDGGYICDSKQIIIGLLLTISELWEDYDKRNPVAKVILEASPESEVELPSQPN